MYLHLRGNTVVREEDVIVILDLESISISKHSREFLRIVEEEGFVRNVSTEIPKSVIVCEIGGQSVVYISNISSKALAGRQRRVQDLQMEY